MFGDINVEIAPYKVIKTNNKFEIRYYGNLLMVTTQVDKKVASSPELFYKLFSYISGKNLSAHEINMTAPVVLDQKNGQTTSMSFVLPQNLTLQSTPSPLDENLIISELNDLTVAVMTFSGFLNQSNISKHETLLKAWIDSKQMKIIGSTRVAGYNPPYTLPFLRRNEIIIEIDANSVSMD